MTIFFAMGLGYSASAVGDLLRQEGVKVVGTAREASRMIEPLHRGFVPVLYQEATVVGKWLSQTTHLLLSASPNEAGDPILENYPPTREAAPLLQWIGYLSTIGVYGNHDGEWIDETAALTPSNARNRARVEAERAWIGFAAQYGIALDIFRLAGIYGPGEGRNPVDKARRGESRRIIKPGQVFNRIHVDDIAQCVVAGMRKPGPSGDARIYNVTDDEPAPPQDVVTLAAQLAGVDLPPEVPFEEADLTPMGRSFYQDNKRVKNAKIKRELDVTLRYPTYREGLRALAGRSSP